VKEKRKQEALDKFKKSEQLDKNIKEAERMQGQTLITKYLWMKENFPTGAKYDIKYDNPDMEHAGNFNYGVMGRAAGLSEFELKAAAGVYQVWSKTSDIDFNWSLNNVAITTEKGSNLRVKTSGRYSVYASKKYTDGPMCVSPTFDITYTLPLDGGLSIFPNPAGNLVTIQSVSSLQGSEFTIYAIDGRQITQGKISQDGSYVMNLAGINAGNYKLVLKTNDQLYTKTLIISN
jgi:hypothetical protein